MRQGRYQRRRLLPRARGKSAYDASFASDVKIAFCKLLGLGMPSYIRRTLEIVSAPLQRPSVLQDVVIAAASMKKVVGVNGRCLFGTDFSFDRPKCVVARPGRATNLIRELDVAVDAKLTRGNELRSRQESRRFLTPALDAALARINVPVNAHLLNVDGDAQTNAITDGLLVVRAMLGLTGDALVAGLRSSAASGQPVNLSAMFNASAVTSRHRRRKVFYVQHTAARMLFPSQVNCPYRELSFFEAEITAGM